MGLSRINIKAYSDSTFIKSVITIFSGGAIAQLVPFLVEPILTRIYTPEEFALFAQFVSITSLFTIVATARYELAIMLPKTIRSSVNVLALSVIITIIVSILSLVIIAIFGKSIVQLLKNEPLLAFLWFIPLAILISGMFQSLNYWMLRHKRFSLISVNRIMQSTTNAATNVLLGLLKWKEWGLVFSYLFGIILSFAHYLYYFLIKDKRSIRLINKSEMKEMANIYSDFPKINSVHAFTDILQQSFVIFLLSYFFLYDEVGYYSRTYRLLMAPVSLFGAALGQVFFQRVSQYYSEGKDIRFIVTKTIRSVFFIAVPSFALLSVVAPWLFEWFLGEGWGKSGIMARYMTPWIMFSFVVSPISTIPIILGRQRTAFLFSLVGNSLIVLSIFLGAVLFQNIYTSLLMVSISMSVYFVILLIWLVQISSYNKK